MSDLDADLYGDLYGDESEFVVPTEPDKEALKPDIESPKPAAVTPAAQPPTPTKSLSPPPKSVVVSSELSNPPMTSTNGAADTSTIQPQPIQTYSTNQEYSQRGNDYIQRNTPQNDYAAQTQMINSSMSQMERHVRPSEMKEEGKMFIGGLNWDTTDEGLRKYFEQFGKVEACTIMRDSTGRSRCFAFLTFEDPSSVNAVMVREHHLDGKIIDPKRAIPRQEHQRAQKLFIGGLAGTVTSESMREFFSQFGKVIDSTVMLDRETGRSKGFGFVSFENANVDPILGFGKLEIDGKMIDVKLAQPRHQRDGMGSGGGSSGFREGGSYGGQSDSGSYGGSSGNYSGGAGGAASSQQVTGQPQAQGNTPFDPQALAALYTRMFQQFGGAATMGMSGMGSVGGMNMMGGGGGMGGMGAAGGFGAGMGRMGGMGAGSGMSMGMGMGGMNAQPMSRGAMGSMGMQGAMLGGPVNAPRGPRGAPSGPQGGVGPQRTTQKNHGYHPYSR